MREREPSAEPYHLFALSNLASLLALVSFPFLIEPRIPSHRQALWWSEAFVAFVILCSIAAWISRRNDVSAPQPEVLEGSHGFGSRGR